MIKVGIRDIVYKKEDEVFNYGIHSIYGMKKDEESVKEIIECIFQTGIGTKEGNNILPLVTPLGNERNNTYLIENLGKKKPGVRYNVLLRVPMYLTNSRGEKVYLGFPEVSQEEAKTEKNETCFLDFICQKFGRIPTEFIYGYYSSPDDIHLNPNYFQNLPPRKQEEFTEEIYGIIESANLLRKLNKYIIEGDTTSIYTYEKLARSEHRERIPLMENVYNAALKERKKEEARKFREALAKKEEEKRRNKAQSEYSDEGER